jgi:hypothetical protein
MPDDATQYLVLIARDEETRSLTSLHLPVIAGVPLTEGWDGAIATQIVRFGGQS